MSQTIWKYPLEKVREQLIEMPTGARPIYVDVQNVQSRFYTNFVTPEETPCLWCIVDPDAPLENRRVRIYGTGEIHAILTVEEYIGTFMLGDGAYVGHVFVSKYAVCR